MMKLDLIINFFITSPILQFSSGEKAAWHEAKRSKYKRGREDRVDKGCPNQLQFQVKGAETRGLGECWHKP